MNASWGTRPFDPEVRVSANRSAPTAVASSENRYAVGDSADTWIRSADRPPSAAIWARDRSTKITSRAMTCRPRYDSMATSTRQATNGGIISWIPLITPPASLGRGARGAEGARQLRDPEVHEVEVRVHARRAARVGRDDHGLGAGALGDLEDLVAVVVVRREQHLDVLLTHRIHHFEHVTGRRRNAGLGLDVVDARHSELAREVVPFLVITDDLLAAERQGLLEPPTELRRERRALVLMGVQELEQLPLAVQVGERRPSQDLDELVAEQRTVHAALEVPLPGGEVFGLLGGHALQAGEDVARDLHRVQRVGPDVRVAEDVDVALGAGEAGGDVEQVDAGVGRHVARPALRHLGVVGLVEQSGDPELEVEAGRDEEVRA